MGERMKIFISYSTGDREIAEAWKQLLEGLTSGFVEVWYASDLSADGGVPGGQDWRKSLILNLNESAVVIAIITPTNSTKPWILWECGVAAGVEEQRPIFPVLYDKKQTDCPEPLKQYQLYDGLADDEVNRICQQVLRIRNERAAISEVVFSGLFNSYLQQTTDFLSHQSVEGDVALQNIVSHELHQRWVIDADWYGLSEQFVVSISDDGAIKRINLNNPDEIYAITESNSIKCFAIIPQTSFLVYGIVGGFVRLADMNATTDNTHNLFNHDHVRIIAFNQFSSIIATGGYNHELQVHKLDLKNFTSKLILKKKYSGPVRAIAWSPKNSSNIAFSTGAIINLQKLDEIGQDNKGKILHGHTATILSIVWTDDGKYIASGDELGNIIVWNAVSGRERFRLNRSLSLGLIRSIAFKPGSTDVFAVGGQTGKVEIINLSGTDPVITKKRISVHPSFVNRVRWSMSENNILLTFDSSIALLSLDTTARMEY